MVFVFHAFHIKQEETVIGCSYAKLATSVEVGSTILIADGTISCCVLEVVNATGRWYLTHTPLYTYTTLL